MRRITCAAVMLAATLAQADPGTWEIDPAKSTIGFTVRHMVVSKARGSFGKFTGFVVGDPAEPTAASLEITIDAASISTENADRDNDLRSPNFFDVARYPTITFKSNRIARREGGLTLTGDLTMHGVTKEVILDVDKFVPSGPDRVRASATTKLDRKDFGIVWNKKLDGGGVALANDVSIQLAVEFVKK